VAAYFVMLGIIVLLGVLCVHTAARLDDALTEIDRLKNPRR